LDFLFDGGRAVAVVVTREDLVELFGERSVVKISSEALAGLTLDPQTRRVLTRRAARRRCLRPSPEVTAC
jgi:hypothetical protein